MKIGLFCNEYPPRQHGGVGSFVHTYSHGLVDAGAAVTVIEMASGEGERYDGKARIVTLRLPRYVPKLDWYRRRLAVHRWLNAESDRGTFDIVEVPDFEGWLPFSRRRYVSVVRLHNTQTAMAEFGGGTARFTARWCERRTLAVNPDWIAFSDFILSTTKRVFGIKPRCSRTVYNPCPPENVLASVDAAADEMQPPYVLFVGSIRRDKGVCELTRAARYFLSSHPELRLVFLGRENELCGRPAAVVLRELAGADHADRLVFPGWRNRPEVLEWMRRASVVALPSKFEAFGLTVAEAILAGAPVVFSRTTFGREIVRDGVTGLLADPEDPQDIARKVSTLLDDPSLARALGENGQREACERFSRAGCLEKSVAFYEPLLAPSK